MIQSTQNRLISLNPANGSAVGTVEISSPGAIADAVRRASAGQRTWSALRPDERAARLSEGAELLKSQARPLSQLLSQETGKPGRASLREIRSVAETLKSRTDDILCALNRQIHRGCGIQSTVRYDPLGVCAVIAPADNPVVMIHRMLIPALLAGNSCVLKPSPETPLIAHRLVGLYQGLLTEGALELIQGGAEQGRQLVAANVQLIAFTGSTRAGKHIMSSAAFGLKRMIMALGGKDALIVLEDADLDTAAKFAVESALGNGGQMCMSTERILVADAVAERFERKVARLTSHYRIGAWDDPGADIGPMISAARRKRVIAQIDDALAKGATALCGGASHPEFFIRPTVLTGVDERMNIAHQETLGPVICISRFNSREDAIALANRSRFALGATVFGSAANAQWVADRLDAGMTGVNKSIFGVGDLPWVGAKQSGYGYQGSPDGYRQFTQPRVTSIPLP